MTKSNSNSSAQKKPGRYGALGQKLLLERATSLRDPQKILIEPPGYAKMSELIVDFARPLLALDPEDEFFEDAIAVAVLAWNIALLLEAQPEVTVAEFFEEMTGISSADSAADAILEQIALLVRRKQRHFSKHRRIILDYEVTESQDLFHVNIISETV